MEELAVLAQVEHTKELTAIPTAFEPGIWRYCFYTTGGILPFMKDAFSRVQISISNIIIDNVDYIERVSIEALRQLPCSDSGWVNGESVVYVRFTNYMPPCVFYSLRCGVLYGYTSGSPKLINNKLYRSGLLSGPVISQSFDAYSYDRMKFNSANIDLDNTKGQFDNVEELFGNEFNLLAGIIEDGKEPHLTDFTSLAQYYISNITATLDKATFHLKDKRERLSAKIPDRLFSEDDYPDIDDNLIGKDMQEVYGHCFGVPGVCLHGKQIYADGNGQLLTEYRFRFSSAITRVDKIQVKMTAGEIDNTKIDGWTTVYERGKWTQNSGWKPGIAAGNITTYLSNGEITLAWEVAKQGGERENGVNEVRMDGVFVNKKTPLDIIIDIMYRYSGVPFDYNHYNINEFAGELGPLYQEIGIMFDKSISVYEAIEKIQGGCVMGFQFCVHENRFTARLDNPNRASDNKVILHTDILNLNEVEIDYNAELYGTYTDIEYHYDYGEESGRHFIDKSMRMDILNLHRVEKEWTVHTLLVEKNDAAKRSSMLLEDFKAMSPLIKNIKLSDKKWFALRIYDIYTIDFSIPGEEIDKYPHNLIRLIEDVGDERLVCSWNEKEEYVTMINEVKVNINKRMFAGTLRCQILHAETDTRTGVTTIDVRVRRWSTKWAA